MTLKTAIPANCRPASCPRDPVATISNNYLWIPRTSRGTTVSAGFIAFLPWKQYSYQQNSLYIRFCRPANDTIPDFLVYNSHPDGNLTIALPPPDQRYHIIPIHPLILENPNEYLSW
jgi:hypothetical protein